VFNGFDADERASKGQTLVIRSPFRPKEPTPIDHYVPPESPPTERQVTRRYLAREIAERVVVQFDPARVESVCQLATAQQAAQQTVNDARARLVALSATPLADTDLDTLVHQEGQRAVLERQIPILEARANAANDALGTAVSEARSDLESLAFKTVLHEVSNQLHSIDDQIEKLSAQRDDLEQAARDARSLLNTWGSTGYHPPVVAIGPSIPAAAPAPVAAPVAPVKKRLFGR
jgi:hypothetical protein